MSFTEALISGALGSILGALIVGLITIIATRYKKSIPMECSSLTAL